MPGIRRQVKCYINGVFYQEYTVDEKADTIHIVIPKPVEQKPNDNSVHKQAPIMAVDGADLRADFNDPELCVKDGHVELMGKG